MGGMGGADGGGPGGITDAARGRVLAGVAATANVLAKNTSMQATRIRTKAFFIGLSFQQSGATHRLPMADRLCRTIEGQTKLESIRGSTTGDIEPATDRSFLP